MMRIAVVLGVLVAVAACGGGDGGGGGNATGGTSNTMSGTGGAPPYVPMVRTLSNDVRRVNVGVDGAIGPFVLPMTGTLTWQIVDMATGIGSDTLSAEIAADAEVRPGPVVTPYARQVNFVNSTATTPPLPAGSYDVVIRCGNIVDDCLFQLIVTGFY